MNGKQREAVFQPEFIEDWHYWVETDRKVALRQFDLIKAVMSDPFSFYASLPAHP